MRIEFSELAELDLIAIKQFIKRDKPQAAAKLIRSIRFGIRRTLGSFPEAGKLCESAPEFRFIQWETMWSTIALEGE